jgi:hypothetical protein
MGWKSLLVRERLSGAVPAGRWSPGHTGLEKHSVARPDQRCWCIYRDPPGTKDGGFQVPVGVQPKARDMNSRVHPKYKTRYRVTNWSKYDQGLVERGNITLWITREAIKGWTAKPTGGRGAPQRYSDLAIETALTLRLLFHLPLRQTEGLLRSLLELMDLSLEAPDHTTLSRCGAVVGLGGAQWLAEALSFTYPPSSSGETLVRVRNEQGERRIPKA